MWRKNRGEIKETQISKENSWVKLGKTWIASPEDPMKFEDDLVKN